MTSGIYKITNKINNNSYIGSSKKIEERWSKHVRNSNNPNSKEYEYPICRAIRKYKIDNFSFEIIEEINTNDQSSLLEKEQYYYDLYSPEYNQMRPDFVPSYNPTEEERKERSIKYSGEGNPFYGKTHFEETKEKLSQYAKSRVGELNPFYGKHHSNETKEKLAKANGKEVIATDSDGEEYFFFSAKEAGEWCRKLGLTNSKTPNSDILKACKNIKNKAFGFYWRYK